MPGWREEYSSRGWSTWRRFRADDREEQSARSCSDTPAQTRPGTRAPLERTVRGNWQEEPAPGRAAFRLLGIGARSSWVRSSWIRSSWIRSSWVRRPAKAANSNRGHVSVPSVANSKSGEKCYASIRSPSDGFILRKAKKAMTRKPEPSSSKEEGSGAFAMASSPLRSSKTPVSGDPAWMP